MSTAARSVRLVQCMKHDTSLSLVIVLGTPAMIEDAFAMLRALREPRATSGPNAQSNLMPAGGHAVMRRRRAFEPFTSSRAPAKLVAAETVMRLRLDENLG